MVTIGHANTPADLRRKWHRICHCSIGWLVVGVLAVIVGILFMAFFVQYWNNMDRWERGLGYAGVGLFCLGVLILAVGIFLACILCYIVKRAETHKPFVPPKLYGAAGLYPRQPQSTQPVQPTQHAPQPSQPSAPPPDEAGHDNNAVELDAVEPQVKDRTF